MRLNHTLGELNDNNFVEYGECLYWITVMGELPSQSTARVGSCAAKTSRAARVLFDTSCSLLSGLSRWLPVDTNHWEMALPKPGSSVSRRTDTGTAAVRASPGSSRCARR